MENVRKRLETLLAGLGEASQFVTSGSLPPVLPGLAVKGIGSLGSPISAADAKRLIDHAKQAPYGRGEQTIVDTNVRRVWQMEPSQFELQNSEWEAQVGAAIEAIRHDFGIQHKVQAELYKLLIYEHGSFFAPHRDTEKVPNMFATLVVCLPSRHEGGTLIVRHDGQAKRIEFGGQGNAFKTQYAAFYADCEHEIEPVTSGFRVCLVYNLATAGKQQPSAPENAGAAAQAGELLRELFAESSDKLAKIAIPFKHQYTEAGLDPAQLKGADRAHAAVLVRAAESLGFECYLALLTHWQSGTPDYSTIAYDPYSRRRSRRRRYGWSDDDGEEADGESDSNQSTDSSVAMEEVFDESLSLDHWLDPQGNKRDLGEIHLEDNEILTLDDRKGWSLRQEISEATGNAGASMERWYRQGCIVLWPREQTFRILAAEGQASAIPELERLLGEGNATGNLAACREFAGAIINHWRPGLNALHGEKGHSLRMLEALDKLDDGDLALRFLREVLPQDFDGSEGSLLLRIAPRVGWEKIGAALRDLIARQQPKDYRSRLGPILGLCRPLCCEPPHPTGGRRDACLAMALELVQAIERWDAKQARAYGSDESRAGIVEGAVRIFAALKLQEQLDWIVEHAIADQRNYDLHQTLIPDVKTIYSWLPDLPAAQAAAARLLAHCKSALEAATAHPIEPPPDWAREAKLGCKCEDCQALSRFLRDPAARVGRFSVRQDRRQHLHQQIDSHDCDCTHVTERRGSPQTLVCTKTQASYERRLQQYNLDQQLLAELNAMDGGTKWLKGPTKRPASKKRSAKK